MIRAALLGAALWAGVASCHAGSLRFCDGDAQLSAEQKDTLLRFGGLLKTELENSGQSVALVARSGLDLARFGQRYSHAGFSLKNSPETPWAVRQLYYACDEQRPRIFDQGIAGFLLGTSDPSVGYVSVVFLPTEASAPVERTANDKRQALQLLAPTYSANAYPFSLLYQNCNQWVVEMLAAAWGQPPGAEGSRARAQQWLQAQGYAGTGFEIGDRLLMRLATAVAPWLHSDDHPEEDLHAARYRISMPVSIESFVQQTVPGATRVELCHRGRRVVVHRGWTAVADGCEPGPEDTVITLD